MTIVASHSLLSPSNAMEQLARGGARALKSTVNRLIFHFGALKVLQNFRNESKTVSTLLRFREKKSFIQLVKLVLKS
jgi:hypothetical protein